MASKRVLITGSADRVEALAKIFVLAGVEQVTLAQLGPGAGPVDYYVQLGVTVPARGDTVVRRVHSFLSDGLLDRFAVVERVLPMLADDAVVLLVAGNLSAEVAAPDDQVARLSMLRVLAHAMRADLAARRIRVRVITGGRSDEKIARFALTGASDPQAAVVPSMPEDDVAGSYEDWRIQVMGLAHMEV
jgi:hypothetical protein